MTQIKLAGNVTSMTNFLRIGFGLACAIGSVAFFANWSYANEASQEQYFGRIVFQESNAIFKMEITKPLTNLSDSDNLFRLWGVTIKPGARTLGLEDGEWLCEKVGSVDSNYSGALTIAVCSKDEIFLSGILVNAGLATEICAETGGIFGGCHP